MLNQEITVLAEEKRKLFLKDKARTQIRTKDQQICNLLRYHCAIRAIFFKNET